MNKLCGWWVVGMNETNGKPKKKKSLEVYSFPHYLNATLWRNVNYGVGEVRITRNQMKLRLVNGKTHICYT